MLTRMMKMVRMVMMEKQSDMDIVKVTSSQVRTRC